MKKQTNNYKRTTKHNIQKQPNKQTNKNNTNTKQTKTNNNNNK